MNIYVSNLGGKITSESLEAIFATYGKVSAAKIVTDVFKNQNGYAHIEMPNYREATMAITKINGCIIDGCAVSVKEGIVRTVTEDWLAAAEN